MLEKKKEECLRLKFQFLIKRGCLSLYTSLNQLYKPVIYVASISQT